MDAKKHSRINQDCHRALSEILRRVKDPRVPELLTVVKVNVSGDLSYCDVYVSAIGGLSKDAMKGLQAASGFVRRELGGYLKVHKTPELRFVADDSIAHSAHIQALLRDLPEANGADDEEEPLC